MKALILAALIVFLFLAAVDVYTVQISFDPVTGEPHRQFVFRLPTGLIGIAAAAGAFLIIHERRKAKGIWFSNSEPLE